MKERVIWVLKWGDRISLLTWPAGLHRLFALRDFRITDEEEKMIVTASSAWLALDLKTRRPVKLNDLFRELNIPQEQHPNSETPEKLPGVVYREGEMGHRVRYSDLDVNGHVNNARYVEWVLNGYAREHIQDHEVSRCEMNFLAECGHGEDIRICTEQRDAETYLHSLIKGGENIEVCRILLAWRAITPQT